MLPRQVRVPGEFERQEALIIAAGQLATRFPETLAAIVAATRRRVALLGVVSNAEETALVAKLLQARGLPADAMARVEVPLDTIWIRDYGPIVVKLNDGSRAVVDTAYRQVDRPADDGASTALAALKGRRTVRAPIVLDGGNFLCNGAGFCVTTKALVDDNSLFRYDQTTIRRILRTFFGVVRVEFLEQLKGEATGHVDMFTCFVARDTIVVGAYDPITDPVNAAILDRNAARLDGLKIPGGRLRVVRVPMPPNIDGVWRTYTNGIFANRVLLVPIYYNLDAEEERQALETFGRLLPGWNVVGLDASRIIQTGGALHCISMNVPSANRPLRSTSIHGTSGRTLGPRALRGS